MLRIPLKSQPPPMVEEPEAPLPPDVEALPEELAEPTTPARSPKQLYQADKIPPDLAGYQGPEKGPFKCGNCDFFTAADSTCHVVAGPVDAEGCCNNFLSITQPDEGDELPEEEEAPEEVEEAPEEEDAGSDQLS